MQPSTSRDLLGEREKASKSVLYITVSIPFTASTPLLSLTLSGNHAVGTVVVEED